MKCDVTRAETRFRLSAKRTSLFKPAGASVQSTTGSRCVRISGSNVGYTMFRGRVKSTGYPLHSPVSPSHSLPCVTVCHHVSTGLYIFKMFVCLSVCFCLDSPPQWAMDSQTKSQLRIIRHYTLKSQNSKTSKKNSVIKQFAGDIDKGFVAQH